MDQKFTVNELAEELGLSHTAIRKRIKRGDLRNVEERIAGRLTTIIFLSVAELSALKKEVGNIKQVSSTFTEHQEDVPTFNKSHEPQSYSINQQELIFKVLDHSEKFNERLESYFNRLVNAESQIKLLENSEQRTKMEYNELNAEIKRLRNVNESLTKENEKLKEKVLQLENKSFLGFFTKK